MKNMMVWIDRLHSPSNGEDHEDEVLPRCNTDNRDELEMRAMREKEFKGVRECRES